MKKLNILITTITSILIIVSSHPASSSPIVRLEIAPVTAVGTTFSLGVFVDGVTASDPFLGLDEVLAFGFDVFSDPGLTYTGATVGTAFSDSSSSLPGTDVGGIAFPGVSGNNIELGSLSFTVTTAGVFNLGISSDILDPNEGLYTLLSFDPIDISATTSITVAPAPVPEPKPVLLVGMAIAFGMINFLTYRKKESGFISKA